MATFYLDGLTLNNSTSVYADIALTTLAPDQFYSDSVISRQQLNGVLLAEQICDSCSTACGTSVSAAGGTGIFRLDVNLGSDTGAVRIRFVPSGIPDGIKATYNSVVNNKLSSEIYGYLQGLKNGTPTYVGATTSNCGLPKLISNVPINTYVGGAFVDSGATDSRNIISGQLALTATSPGICTMAIPKPAVTPSVISLEMIGPCPTTGWNVTVDCPQKLISFNTTTVDNAESGGACAKVRDSLLYNMPVTGTAGVPALHDFVFQDTNGVLEAANGYYGIDSAKYIKVTNGIIEEIANCDTAQLRDCTSALDYTVANTFNNVIGDVIQFQVGTPGVGATYCGTIQQLNSGATPDATATNGIVYECGDIVHCAE